MAWYSNHDMESEVEIFFQFEEVTSEVKFTSPINFNWDFQSVERYIICPYMKISNSIAWGDVVQFFWIDSSIIFFLSSFYWRKIVSNIAEARGNVKWKSLSDNRRYRNVKLLSNKKFSLLRAPILHNFSFAISRISETNSNQKRHFSFLFWGHCLSFCAWNLTHGTTLVHDPDVASYFNFMFLPPNSHVTVAI